MDLSGFESIEDLVAKFSKPGRLCIDLFEGNIATSNACLFLNKDILFIGWDIGRDCVDAALPDFLLVFGKRVPGDVSDLTVDYNVRDSDRVYVAEMETLEKKRECLKGWYQRGVLQFNYYHHTLFGSYETSIHISPFSPRERVCPPTDGPVCGGIVWKFRTSKR